MSSSPAVCTRSAGSSSSPAMWRTPWRPCAGSRPSERAQSTVDPSMLRWHEELAEALLANDAPEEAAALLADVRPVAERLGRTTVLLGCDRAYALYLAASGKPDEAAELLSDAAERFDDGGPAAGARPGADRARPRGAPPPRRSAAQSALQAAAARLRTLGALPWLALATETLPGPQSPRRPRAARCRPSRRRSCVSRCSSARAPATRRPRPSSTSA